MHSALITPAQLQELDASNCVIFDCRFSLEDCALGREQYLEGHIPGAFHLDMEEDLSGPKETHGGRHPLPDQDHFCATMQRYGVNTDTLVVAYDDNRMAGAARLWWLLNYFGHSNVQVLDGGIRAWQAISDPLETVEPRLRTGNFRARPQPGMVVDIEELKRETLSSTLIDAREAARYRGEQEPIDPVAGHIPGARNLPWLELIDAQGCFISEEQQRQQWLALGPLQRPVVYCGSGVTACIELLSLAMVGAPPARLYSGSWSDWCSYPENPVATGDTP